MFACLRRRGLDTGPRSEVVDLVKGLDYLGSFTVVGRFDRQAPATPNSATNKMTVGIPRDSRRKLNLLSGIPIRPPGHGWSNRCARPVKFHMTHGSTILGKACMAMRHHKKATGVTPAIAIPAGVTRKSFSVVVISTRCCLPLMEIAEVSISARHL